MSRYLLCAGAIVGLCAGFASAANVDEDQKPKSATTVIDAASGQLAGNPALERALATMVPEFRGTTLIELVALARQCKVDLSLDIEALKDAVVSPALKIAVSPAANVSLRAVIEGFIAELDLIAVVRDGKLLITTKDKADVYAANRIYPVGDLLSEPVNDKTLPAGGSLIEVVTHCVEPSSWSDVAGSGTIGGFKASLTISQSQDAHKQIEWLLAALRKSRVVRGTPPAEPIWARPPGDADVCRRLAKKSTLQANFKFVGTPLCEAIRQVAKSCDLPSRFAMRDLAEHSIDLNKPITRDLRDVAPPLALAMLLDDLDLSYAVEYESLVIASKDNADSRLVGAVYPVADLIGPDGSDFPALIELITDTVQFATWDEVGGPGSIAGFPHSASLVILQTDAVHTEIARLLGALREACSKAEQEQQDAPKPVAATSTRPADDLAIEKILDEALVELQASSLQHLVTVVRSHRIDAILDLPALEIAAIDVDARIPQWRVAKTSLRAAIDSALEQWDLAAVVRDGKLWITTDDIPQSKFLIRVYPVRDLLVRDSKESQAAADWRPLVETLMQTVRRTTWGWTGGPGEIAAFKNVIAVSQSQSVHREVEWTLQALRQCRAVRKAPPGQPIWARSPQDDLLYRQLAHKSAQTVDFEFAGTPLVDAIDQFARFYKLPMRFDVHALDDEGVSPSAAMTHQLRQVPPRVALESLLRARDLTYAIAQGAITITTRQRADGMLVIAVYPVEDLVSANGLSFRALVDLIEAMRAESWVAGGGPGTVSAFPPISSLVVSQTERVHEEVATLLAGLRAARAAQSK